MVWFVEGDGHGLSLSMGGRNGSSRSIAGAFSRHMPPYDSTGIRDLARWTACDAQEASAKELEPFLPCMGAEALRRAGEPLAAIEYHPGIQTLEFLFLLPRPLFDTAWEALRMVLATPTLAYEVSFHTGEGGAALAESPESKARGRLLSGEPLVFCNDTRLHFAVFRRR